MKRLVRFFRSMAGRIFLISVVGAIVSAGLAMWLATAKHEMELRRLELQRVTDRVQDFNQLVGNASPAVAGELIRQGIPGFRPAGAAAHGEGPDPVLTAMLRQRLGSTAVSAEPAKPDYCIRRPALPYRTSLDSRFNMEVHCWFIRLRLQDQTPLRMMYLEQRAVDRGSLAADPVYFLILVLGVGAAALLAARVAASPLHELSEAATALGDDLDRQPLPEHGPSEVRNAARAFNSMQTVLRRHLKQRHRMLAAITHDLQTPLTRLRLRVDKVADEPLRERMISDLAAMQILIREGLELARGDVVPEQAVKFDLDSLIGSIAADAADAGFDVTVTAGSGRAIVGRPHSLRRAISNLVQNAVQYAGSGELSVEEADGVLKIIVRDHGPGIPPDHLRSVLEPFVRLETSRSRETGGVGLGLTIAQTFAERNGGGLELVNRPEGGLDAVITLPVQAPTRPGSRRRRSGALAPS
jgi:signal transduction histidine kinase